MVLTSLALLTLAIWIYLLVFRGDFWRASKNVAPVGLSDPEETSRIVAVLPARNEAHGIAAAIGSLFAQDFPAPMHIVIVDDDSDDGTAEVARDIARRIGKSDQVSVLPGKPLPAGWTGKLWAVQQGLEYAAQFDPSFYLLTDADVVHANDSVRQLSGIAESGRYDLVSFMVKLHTQSLAERALIPAFVFFFFQLYPPKWIRSPKKRGAGAAGGCMLVRAEALASAGGVAALRDQVIDDCALARAIKRAGGGVWLGLAPQTYSLRQYEGFADVRRMIARTAFNQLRHSTLLLSITLMGLSVTYVAPVALLFIGDLKVTCVGAVAYLIMSLSYFPIIRFYRLNPMWSFALPLVALFYAEATLYSAIRYWLGKGGEWKGRAQDLGVRKPD